MNLVNGKRYVGSAVNIRGRWDVHRNLLTRGKHHSIHLQRAWNKHGSDCFQFRIIEQCFVFALIFREQHYIDKLKPEYNMAPQAGNSLGVKLGPEARAKITENNKNMSPEHREKFTFAGQKHSEESIQKMIQARSGIKQSAETIAKRVAKLIGRTRSPEQKARMASSQVGKKLTPEHRAKLSLVHSARKREQYSKIESGHVGIYRRKGGKKWTTNIRVNKKLIHLGEFDRIEDAIAARISAEKQYFRE